MARPKTRWICSLSLVEECHIHHQPNWEKLVGCAGQLVGNFMIKLEMRRKEVESKTNAITLNDSSFCFEQASFGSLINSLVSGPLGSSGSVREMWFGVVWIPGSLY